MTNLTLAALLSITISTLALTTYLVNYFGLKMINMYKGFHYKMFLIFTLVPYFNLIFLIWNVILFATNVNGYKVVKKKKASTRTSSKRRVYVKA